MARAATPKSAVRIVLRIMNSVLLKSLRSCLLDSTEPRRFLAGGQAQAVAV